MDTLPGRLTSALRDLDWSAKELAQRSGVSESVISRTSEGMNLWVAIALARAMGLRVGWLVANEQPQWERRPSRVPPPSPELTTSDEQIPESPEERESGSHRSVR